MVISHNLHFNGGDMGVPSISNLTKQGGSEWDLGAVFKIEQNKIKEMIKEHSVQATTRPGVTPAVVKQEATDNQTIWVMKNDIKRRFHEDNRLDNNSVSLFEAAQKGDLNTLSPTKSEVRIYHIIAIISVLIEIAVILFLSFSEGEISFPQLLLAILLAAGGWFSGIGVGQLMFNHYIDDQHKKNVKWISQKEKISTTRVWMALFFGLLLLFACSYFRYYMSEKEIIAGGISLMLGLFIMISEAFASDKKNQYTKYSDLMFKAQKYYAVTEHIKYNPDVADQLNYNPMKDPCALDYLAEVRKRT